MSAAAYLPLPAPPPARARVPRATLIAVAVGVLMGVASLALVYVLLLTPSPDPPPCPPDGECGNPPTGPGALINGTVWQSSSGVLLEYDSSTWSPEATSASELQLRDGEAVWVWVEVHPNTSPADAFDRRIQDLRGRIPDLATDDDAAHQILGPSIGYRDGLGSAYGGTTQTAQGPGDQVSVTVMASSFDDVTVVVSAVVATDQANFGEGVSAEEARGYLLGWVDSVLNTLRWPSEIR